MSIYNSIEEELWRIFTFYGMHSDPATPDVWNRANFVRFAKDCQIISKKLNATAVELEITRLARLKADIEPGSTITIGFSDFLNLLDALALKVYPRDSPEIAVKRLILENVLLLANRRIVSTESYNLDNAEALKVVQETFVKSLTKIFEYYVDLAEKRRNQLVTVEKMKLKDISITTNKEVSVASMQQTQALNKLKEFCKSQRGLIGYKEYTQFCHDFNLKSTALLTAIQVGEAFLNIVPFSYELKSEQGMSFDLFCRVLLALAALGYRDAAPGVSPADKVKALLLYMWKTVNDSDNKTVRKVTSSRATAVASHAGSLNLFGSAVFSDQFLTHWMKDSFRDYTVPLDSEGVKADGVKMVKRLVGAAAAAESDRSSHSLDATSSGAVPGAPLESPAMGRARTNSSASVTAGGGRGSSTSKGAAPAESSSSSLVNQALAHGGSLLRSKQRKTLDFTTPHHVMVHSSGGSSSKNRRPKCPLKLFGGDLQQLLLMKPELTEFLFLEIQNMKLTEAVLVSPSK